MSRQFALLLCVSVPSFMINLDANIVAVSLRVIATSLHADFAAIEWVISAYTLAFASLVLPAGALADRFGRKRVLIIGLSVFTLASAICGAASSSVVLNYARALQGVGAALQLSAALAILSHGFAGRARAKAFAFWGSVIGIAIMLGPVAGGVITQLLGWEWAFYINIPVGLAMIALTAVAVTESKDPHANRIDTAGVLSFGGFLGLLTWALISGNSIGWHSRSIHVRVVIALLLLVVFLVVESKQRRPMVELAYFKRSTYVGANVAAVAYAVAFLTMLTYLPFFFQSAMGYSPINAGLLMLPLAAPLFVVPRIVAVYFDHRYSGRALLTAGLLLLGAGLLLTSVRIGQFSYPSIAWSMFISSLGAGILNGQIAKVGMTVIPVERAGMASGISGTMRFSGVVVGFAALGAILFRHIADALLRDAPSLADHTRLEITRVIANGDLAAARTLLTEAHVPAALAGAGLAHGYQAIMIAAGVTALIAAALTAYLVNAHETAPHTAH